jgi:hypothetical protein
MSKKVKTIHYVDGSEVDEEELDGYCCNYCGISINEYEWGFREDAYGNYYCDSEQECRDAMINDMNYIEYTKEEEEINEEE